MNGKNSVIKSQQKTVPGAGGSGNSKVPFFAPVIQAKKTVNNPGDAYELEADQIAEEVVRNMPAETTAKDSFFFKPVPHIVQRAPALIQRDENDKKPPEDTGSKVLSEGASITYSQLKLQPGFEDWKEKQVAHLKFKLWENQPADFKFGMVAFGLSGLGLFGAALAADPGFRSKTVTALDDTSIPLFLLPGSEYLALSGFKYKLPSATNAPYTFKTEFDFDFFTKMAREKWGGPKIGLTASVNSEYSEDGGFRPVTGGKIGLTLGGGIINLQGFYNEHLPPSPMLISDPSKGESPAWLMRSLPGQLEENLPLGTGVYLTVDVLRLPELFGGGQKAKQPSRKEGADELSRKENNSNDTVSGQPVPAVVTDVLAGGGGSPLDDSSRAMMEDRFNQDFSDVKIHTDSKAAESAKAINAKAYTSGKDIVFDNGQYDPSVESGKKLLAHELVHVVQQSGAVQRKDEPGTAMNPVPARKVDDPVKDAEAVQKIREKLESGNYAGAFLELNDHIEWEGVLTKKRWLRRHNDIRLMFLKHLPAVVIADVYSAADLMLRPATTAWDIIDCWYPSEQEKQLLYTQNLPLFDRMLLYISPYTGFAMRDVIDELIKELNKKEYTSSFNNKEFHIIHLLAPTVERKLLFYKQQADLFKIVNSKFDPFTGIRKQTMEYLTDTNEVDREQALKIYEQLKVLPEEQRKAFLDTALFAGALEADKDAEAYYKKNFGKQYKALPHNWDSAILPWNWPKWDAPFAERLTIDHVALMSSALNYEDKETREFGFDRGLDFSIDKNSGKDKSDAERLMLQMKDPVIFNNPQRITLLLAIAVRGGLEKRITEEILLPKSKAGELTPGYIEFFERNGFMSWDGFRYHADKAFVPEYVYGQLSYIVDQTLFGGDSGKVVGEQRGTFDLRKLQDTEENRGSLGGMKFGIWLYDDDDKYNDQWLEDQIKGHSGSETLLANLKETKGDDRRGKIFASIRNDIRQANIYASTLPVDGLNYFGAGSLYRSGPGVLHGLAIHLSWTKDTSDPGNTISLSLGIENIQLDNFELIAPKSTLAIGHIGIKGFRISLSQDQLPAAEGLFAGLFKNADYVLKALMGLLPNVLKLLPYAVMTMTEEFKGAKAHVYKDALGEMVKKDFSSLKTALTFTSLEVKNLYDTSAGFLDNFSIEEQKNNEGDVVRQGLMIRETNLWTIDAAQNIRSRIRTIDQKIRAGKIELIRTNRERKKLDHTDDTQIEDRNDLDLEDIESLESRKTDLLKIAAEKGINHQNRDAEMSSLRKLYPLIRELTKQLDDQFNVAKTESPLYDPLHFRAMEAEKEGLQKDLDYLDNQYFEDKKTAEGNDKGAERFEARQRKASFDAKYKSFDVDIALRGINLEGGNYVKDLINESLRSLGFENPELEGLENIKIGAIDSSFTASSRGASAREDKPGVAIRRLQIPLIKAPGLDFKTDSMRLRGDSPKLENVFVSVVIDFAANPLEKDPNQLYKYKLSSLWIEHAFFNGLQLYMGKDIPLLDFPSGVPVEAWGIYLWDYDPDKGNINLKIRDIKAQGVYKDQNEADKTSKEIGFGIDTTLDNTKENRTAAVEIHYDKKDESVITKLNIASAWVPSLNVESPVLSVTSLPGTNAVELKNIEADVKVLLKKESADDTGERPMTLEINTLKIGEISAQGITVVMREEPEAETADTKRKKTARKVQVISLPENDKVFIRNFNVSGLRIALEKEGVKLSTTGNDASVKLGESDLSGIGYSEKNSKGSMLKAISVYSGKFDLFTMEAIGRNGREYKLTEFFKFFGRTRLEGLDASASYSDDDTKISAGVTGQKKITQEGLKNVPISIDFHEATEKDPEHYSLRLPLSRINLPALNIVNGDHHIIIPRPTDKYSLSYLSDVDVKLRAYVKIPDEGKVSYDIYLDSLDIGKMVVYGLEYHNSKLGVDVTFDKVAPISIPDVKAGGFRFSSTKGFDVFGKAGGWVDAAVGPGKDIEASFASIKARLEDGEFLAESDKGRSALDINIASLGYRQDADGNMSVTLQSITGGFPKMKISQTDPVTKVKTVTDISSIDKALYAEKVVVKLNADKTKEVTAEGLSAGGLKIVSTETKGAEVNTTTVNLDPGAVSADTTSVKINADNSKEISIKGIKGRTIKADILSTGGPGGKSQKIITLPDPEAIKVDEVKIKIDAAGQKTITVVQPVVKKVKLEIPSQEKFGDYLSVVCDLKVHGDVTLGDGNYASMELLSSMKPGAAVDAFVVNIPDYMPVEITNIRLENKDTTGSAASGPSVPKPLTADQQKLLDLEKAMNDAKDTMYNTPSELSAPDGMYIENPDWDIAYEAWSKAKQGYEDQKAKIIKDAKAEAAASMTKKYLDAVQDGHAYASLVVYGNKLPLTIETYKGEKYVEISDDLVKGLKPVIRSVISSTASADFWSSDEMKKAGKALQRWYTYGVPYTRGLIDSIAEGYGVGAALVFIDKTTIEKGVLDDDPNMYGIKFNFDTSWLLDVSSADEFGVPLCEVKYKHPLKDDFYNLYGMIEYYGYVSPALVSLTGQRDAANVKNLPTATQAQLDDKGIKEAVAQLVGYIKYGFTMEADNIVRDLKKNITKVEVAADLTLTPQDIITTLLKQKKQGRFEFKDPKKQTIEGIHIEGNYNREPDREVTGKVGGGPAGIGNIIIPGATYTNQEDKTKVSYDSISISPSDLNYKNDTFTLTSGSIMLRGLKAAFKK